MAYIGVKLDKQYGSRLARERSIRITVKRVDRKDYSLDAINEVQRRRKLTYIVVQKRQLSPVTKFFQSYSNQTQIKDHYLDQIEV